MDMDKEHLINFMMHSKLFTGIDHAGCEKLLNKFSLVKLASHELLFRQYDLSDSLYILIEGRLTALLSTKNKNTRLVGIIEKGEVVGEVGAISNQPRSLTVKALTDSLLLKIPIEQLHDFFEINPGAVNTILNAIIERSQATIKLLSGSKPYPHLLVVPANEETDMANFMQNFFKNMPQESAFIVQDLINNNNEVSEEQIRNLIVEAESSNKMIITFIDPHKRKIPNIWINFLGGIYVVAQGGSHAYFSQEVYNLLNYSMMPFMHHTALILMQPEKIALPEATKPWLESAVFTIHHHVKHDDVLGYQRLIRFMTGKARGLVLSGGGNKGWAHIGVLRALMEAKISIDAIGGTSIGAIAGAFYTLFDNYDEIKEKFFEVIKEVGNPYDAKSFTIPIVSVLSGNKPAYIFEHVFGSINIEDLWLPYFCMGSNLSLRKEEIYQQGKIWENVRKSASLPGFVPPVAENGQLIVDGGLLNNLPVDVMRRLLGEHATIIAVSLTDNSRIHTDYDFPISIPFKTALQMKFGKTKYKFPNFFDVFFQSLLLGATPKESANEIDADILVKPDVTGFHPLRPVKPEEVDVLIKLGYEAALARLKDREPL